MLSVEQLRQPATRSEVLTWASTLLQSLGFETTGWQDGRIQKTLLYLVATIGADLTEIAKQTVEFGFNDYASGDPLNEFSRSRFSNTKTPARKTQGPMLLSSTATIPHTVLPGQLLAATSDDIQFRSITGGTVPAGGALPVTFEAVIAGERGNVATGAVTRLLTPLAGVTVSNGSGAPWYTIAGLDETLDRTLRQSNSTQWSLLSVQRIREAYENLALANGAVKVKVDSQNPRGPGTVDVYASGSFSLLADGDLTALQAVFADRTFGTDATWPASAESRVAVLHPITQALTFTGTLYHDAGITGAVALARSTEALEDFLRRTPIGGWSYAPGPVNTITLGDVLEALENVEAMRTVNVSLLANVPIGPLSLVIPGWTFTTVAVTP